MNTDSAEPIDRLFNLQHCERVKQHEKKTFFLIFHFSEFSFFLIWIYILDILDNVQNWKHITI